MESRSIDSLDTPCLLLDFDAVEHNIQAMADLLDGATAKVRPHFKTPKSPEVARRQLEAGAVGITVAKLGEAEVLADAGLGPILMANQVVGRIKVDRLMALLGRGVDITVAVESRFNINELAAGAERSGQTPQAIIEVDVGMDRCGTREPEETVALARTIVDRGIRYRGIMGYEGHAVLTLDREEREAKARDALEIVSQHVAALRAARLDPEIVSTSGTGTVEFAKDHPDVTELQAGSYVFMDGLYRRVLGDDAPFRNALSFLTTVVAVHDDYAVCDAGMKSLTNEFGAPRSPDGRIKVDRLSEEHGHLRGDGVSDLRPGDRVEIIPSHGDTTLNLHDTYYVTRDGLVVDEWPILAARAYR
jgi:D-serine deaminase-like pyridoxal phosphate-dependent protein